MEVVEPQDGVVDGALELVLVASLKLVVLDRVTVGLGLGTVDGLGVSSNSLILSIVLLSLGHHAAGLLLGKIGDGDVVGLDGGLLVAGGELSMPSASVLKVASIWGTPQKPRDAGELELAEEVAVLGAGTLALVGIG
jgi:hypothetical protein